MARWFSAYRERRAAPGAHVAALAFGLAIVLTPVPSRAEGHALTWSWPRFQTIEYGTTVAIWLELAFVQFRTDMTEEARWVGPLPGDDVARDLFRLRDRSARDAMNVASDPIPLVIGAFPLVVDGVLVPLVFDDLNFDVFWQITWINAMSIGVQALMHRATTRIAARERPETPECDADPEYHADCGGRNNSFYSGHTAGAFVGAGLICAHHMHLPLFGGGGGDIAACTAGVTVASITGALRLTTDQHWLSDNLVGAAMGFAAGYGLPVLLHYRWEGSPSEASWAKNVVVAPLAEADAGGLSLVGVF